tara:strand:+ start:390 stop:887 length:498 start_codon:yes stop_codon:yes gene_type:complete
MTIYINTYNELYHDNDDEPIIKRICIKKNIPFFILTFISLFYPSSIIYINNCKETINNDNINSFIKLYEIFNIVIFSVILVITITHIILYFFTNGITKYTKIIFLFTNIILAITNMCFFLYEWNAENLVLKDNKCIDDIISIINIFIPIVSGIQIIQLFFVKYFN